MTPLLWHGVLMGAAWLVLLPAGVLVARFFKVRPGQDYPYDLDDRFWWDAHRALQVSGTLLAAFAAWLAYDALGERVDWPVLHVRLGLGALGLLLLQVASPLFRGTKGGPTDTHADPYDLDTWRGDHFDMTWRRRAFELVHKKLGYIGLAAAVCAAWTGTDQAGLSAWWKVVLSLPVLGFAALFAAFTFAQRRVDTWHAIWGPHGR